MFTCRRVTCAFFERESFEVYNNMRRMEKMGEAQAATMARDKKLDELAGWVSGLRAVAKVALDDNPQWLEKLGILARTGSKANH